MSELILVTGANGFLALHIIKQLLTEGYRVRGTLRRRNQGAQVQAALAANHTPHLERLSFVQADLTEDAPWPAAMAGVSRVVSVAAPVFVNGEKATAALTQTATAGTLRILAAAVAAHVQRVVMTANLGAIGFSNHSNHPTTEADWTDPNEPGLSAYERSKLMAEKAAWAFAQTHHLELATVAAGAMLGPALGQHVSGSFGLVRQLLDGSRKITPPIRVNISDVRDVADAHVRALFAPEAAGERFLAVAEGSISLPEISALIRQQRPQLAAQLPAFTLPIWVLHVAAHFSEAAKEGRLFLTVNHDVSTAKARARLGWQPKHTITETILTTVDILAEQP